MQARKMKTPLPHHVMSCESNLSPQAEHVDPSINQPPATRKNSPKRQTREVLAKGLLGVDLLETTGRGDGSMDWYLFAKYHD
jgi:hypothetical protein